MPDLAVFAEPPEEPGGRTRQFLGGCLAVGHRKKQFMVVVGIYRAAADRGAPVLGLRNKH